MKSFVVSLGKHTWTSLGIFLILIGVATWVALSLPMALSAVAIGFVCVTIDLIKHHLYVGGTVAIVIAFVFGFLAGEWAGQPYEIVYPPSTSSSTASLRGKTAPEIYASR